MQKIKKIVKIILITVSLLFLGLYLLFVRFSNPDSDQKILDAFEKFPVTPKLSYKTYKNFTYRTISTFLDKNAPTLIFVHGTIGSCSNFIKYMSDKTLTKKFNMLAYDRIGYNYQDKNQVQESIAFERDLLDDLLTDTPNQNNILIGYSFGGPIALASQSKVKKIILVAPAVYSEAEKTPWIINFYKWKATRWLVPNVWKQASKEKMSHAKDLQSFEQNWKHTPNKVISIHGETDKIVPYENSLFLEKEIPSDQFQLISIKSAGHDLIWSQFSFIKQQLLKQLD